MPHSVPADSSSPLPDAVPSDAVSEPQEESDRTPNGKPAEDEVREEKVEAGSSPLPAVKDLKVDDEFDDDDDNDDDEDWLGSTPQNDAKDLPSDLPS